MSGHTPWRKIKHKKDAEGSTERTEQGYEVPVPKRGDVMGNLKKIAKPPAKPSGSRSPKQ